MAYQRGSGGVVGIGVPAVANSGYSTVSSITASHLFYCDAFGVAGTGDLFDNRTVATGYEEGSAITGMQDTTEATISGPLCDLSFPILWALALGTTTNTVNDTSAYEHIATPCGVNSELPYVSLYFKHTGIADTSTVGSVRLDGAVLDTLTISASNGGPWRYSARFITSGTISSTTVDLSAKTKPSVLPFRMGNTSHQVSTTTPSAISVARPTAPTFIPSAGTGWTLVDWSQNTQSISYTVNNNCITFSSGTGAGRTNVVRQNRVITASTSLMFDSTPPSIRTLPVALGAGNVTYRGLITACGSGSLAGAGSAYYGFDIQVPKAAITSVNMEPTLGPRMVTVNFTAIDSAQSGISTIYALGMNANDVAYVP